MPDIATRIETTKAELSQLTKEVESVQKTKRDQTLISAAAKSPISSNSNNGGGGWAPIRGPPSTKLRRTLKGHFGKVTALHWAGDSQRLVSASQDGNLLVWNAITTNKVQSIPLKSSYVMSVGMEPTLGNMVACGGLDNLCTIYKLNPNTPTVTTPLVEMASHDGFVSCCRFVNEQHIITSSGDSTCIRWDIATGKVLETFYDHTADVTFLALPTGSSNNTFVSSSVDRTVKLWDVRTPQSCVQSYGGYHRGDINGVDYMPSSDGKVFASCSEDQTIHIYDTRAYNVIGTYGGGGGGGTTNTNTTTTATGGGGGDGDVSGGGVHASTATTTTAGGAVAATTDSAAAAANTSTIIPLTTTNNNNSSLEGYTSISFSKSGRLIFCAHIDGSVIAFDVLSDKTTTPALVLTEAHEQVVSCIGVSPNGEALCTGSWDTTLKIWA